MVKAAPATPKNEIAKGIARTSRKRKRRDEPLPKRTLPPDDLLKPWARTLKRLMKERRLSQQKVADETRIDKNTLSALMHGRDTNTRTLDTLATFFRVPVGEFFIEGSMAYSTLVAAVSTPQHVEAFLQRLAPYAVMVASQMARGVTGPLLPDSRELREFL